LYVVPEPKLPTGLVLVDTPDFDSVYLENRSRAEALLLSLDVVIFVVTRHTYQNAALVSFARSVASQGRPYLLFYNEAPSASMAHEHRAKVASDIGVAPLGLYYAEHDPDVQQASRFLVPKPLDGSPDLLALLANEGAAETLKTRALSASLDGVVDELDRLAGLYREMTREPERLHARLRHELVTIGERAARLSVPADVLIEAFRDALDSRSPAHRVARWAPRQVAKGVTMLGKGIRQFFTGLPLREIPVAEASDAAVRDGLRRMIDSLSTEVAAWKGDEETLALLRRATGHAFLEQLSRPLHIDKGHVQREDRKALYAFCRDLVLKGMPGGAQEDAMQAVATLVYFAPALLGGAAAVATGGLGGHDVVWVGTLVTTPVLEKLVDLLGREIREAVVTRWARQHGETLARELETTPFPKLTQRLAERIVHGTRAAAALDAAHQSLASLAQAKGGWKSHLPR
jgi:hypothetical protein